MLLLDEAALPWLLQLPPPPPPPAPPAPALPLPLPLLPPPPGVLLLPLPPFLLLPPLGETAAEEEAWAAPAPFCLGPAAVSAWAELAHLPRLLPRCRDLSPPMGPAAEGGAGELAWAVPAAGCCCLGGLPRRPRISGRWPRGGREGKGRLGRALGVRTGGYGEAPPLRGIRAGEGGRRAVRAEGSIRIAGVPLRIATGRHLVSSSLPRLAPLWLGEAAAAAGPERLTWPAAPASRRQGAQQPPAARAMLEPALRGGSETGPRGIPAPRAAPRHSLSALFAAVPSHQDRAPRPTTTCHAALSPHAAHYEVALSPSAGRSRGSPPLPDP